MKTGLRIPPHSKLDEFLLTKCELSPSYPERLDTHSDFKEKRKSPLAGKYDYDENRILLGKGRATFERAKQAVRDWQMFPEKWTKVYPEKAPIRAGQQVAVLFRVMGLWWWNSSEIQYTVDEPDRFGFAYGTLPGHVESGEELFQVELDENEQVWYVIKAFSRPAYWIVRLAYPFARSQQKRFVRESQAKMQAYIQKNTADV